MQIWNMKKTKMMMNLWKINFRSIKFHKRNLKLFEFSRIECVIIYFLEMLDHVWNCMLLYILSNSVDTYHQTFVGDTVFDCSSDKNLGG